MTISVKYFGAIAEATGKDEEELTIDQQDINTLFDSINSRYDLNGIDYSIAVNKRIVNQNEAIQSNDEIALLPPFAGG